MLQQEMENNMIIENQSNKKTPHDIFIEKINIQKMRYLHFRRLFQAFAQAGLN
jgi:hypothetical protein